MLSLPPISLPQVATWTSVQQQQWAVYSIVPAQFCLYWLPVANLHIYKFEGTDVISKVSTNTTTCKWPTTYLKQCPDHPKRGLELWYSQSNSSATSAIPELTEPAISWWRDSITYCDVKKLFSNTSIGILYTSSFSRNTLSGWSSKFISSIRDIPEVMEFGVRGPYLEKNQTNLHVMYVVYNTVVQLQLFNACLHTFIDSDRCWLCFNCSNVSCDSFSSSVSSLIWKFTHGWCSQWHQDMFSFQQYLWKPSDCNSNEKTCIYIRMMKVYCVYVKSMKLTCVHTRTPYELPLGTVSQCTHSFPVMPSAPLWVIGLCGCGSKCFAVVFCSHQLSFQAVKTKGGFITSASAVNLYL